MRTKKTSYYSLESAENFNRRSLVDSLETYQLFIATVVLHFLLVGVLFVTSW